MISLQNFIDTQINEMKEDLTSQIIIIMGYPGLGKTYWMQHTGVNFFKKQGLKITPLELDIDHTLKKYQLAAFPDFCYRVLNYKNTSIFDKKTGKSVHNNNAAWKTFIKNEQQMFQDLNDKWGGNKSNVPKLDKLDYEFIAPYISRYDAAASNNKKAIEKEFTVKMQKEYFNKVFASDFSVRGEAKEEYNDDMINKIAGVDSDVFIAISGAKMKTIDKILKLCPENATCRLVYLHGDVDKAVYQDAHRDRSGGEEFVRDYAKKINVIWDELISTYKDKGIYKMYELVDKKANDTKSYPIWYLNKVYK